MVSALLKFVVESLIQKYSLSICSSFKQSLTALSIHRTEEEKRSGICPQKLLSLFFKYFRQKYPSLVPLPQDLCTCSSSAWTALPQHILLLLLSLFRGDLLRPSHLEPSGHPHPRMLCPPSYFIFP